VVFFKRFGTATSTRALHCGDRNVPTLTFPPTVVPLRSTGEASGGWVDVCDRRSMPTKAPPSTNTDCAIRGRAATRTRRGERRNLNRIEFRSSLRPARFQCQCAEMCWRDGSKDEEAGGRTVPCSSFVACSSSDMRIVSWHEPPQVDGHVPRATS